MRITKKILETVIPNTNGNGVKDLVDVLVKGKALSELELSDILKIEVNEVRNKLYQLADKHIVTFIKKRDKVKGWYIYYWSIEKSRVIEEYVKIIEAKIRKIDRILKKEDTTQYFYCKNECFRLDFDNAASRNFQCPECGQILEQENNAKKINTLKTEKKELKEELKKFK